MSENAADDAPGDAAAGDGTEANAVHRALDLLVFAPVGVALTVVEDLPGLVAKGRRRVEDHVRNARVVGQFVVGHGQQDMIRRVGRFLGGESPEASDPSPAEPKEASTHPSPPKPAPDPADEAVVQRALAGYDTLSASQVVRRLESLGPDELRAVHQHEASHRNRRTILNRTNQLLDGGAAG